MNWLQQEQHLSEHGNAIPAQGGDEPTVSISSSSVSLALLIRLFPSSRSQIHEICWELNYAEYHTKKVDKNVKFLDICTL